MKEHANAIKFDCNYPKLHNQKEARLVMVIQEISGEMLLHAFPDLTFYDTLRDDGLYYGIRPDFEYMLLLFVGDKNIMFPTLRKQNEENAKLYAESIGEIFKISVKARSVENGGK